MHLMVLKLFKFCLKCDFGLLLELHQKRSARACKTGFFCWHQVQEQSCGQQFTHQCFEWTKCVMIHQRSSESFSALSVSLNKFISCITLDNSKA